jgi:hypothetical protein
MENSRACQPGSALRGGGAGNRGGGATGGRGGGRGGHADTGKGRCCYRAEMKMPFLWRFSFKIPQKIQKSSKCSGRTQVTQRARQVFFLSDKYLYEIFRENENFRTNYGQLSPSMLVLFIF